MKKRRGCTVLQFSLMALAAVFGVAGVVFMIESDPLGWSSRKETIPAGYEWKTEQNAPALSPGIQPDSEENQESAPSWHFEKRI